MTSDDELLELETAAIQSIDGELRGPALKAAARIRELEAELDSLGDLSEWEKVCAGTHVIVPVEPTPEMQKAGFMANLERTEYTLESRAAIALTTIDADVDALRTLGYATPGDGGAAIYKRVGSEDRLDNTLPNIIGIYRAMIRAAQPDASD